MRKVLLRWKFDSLRGIKEIDSLMDICDRIEVLGHLSLGPDGVTQLTEVKLKDGREIGEISDLDSFTVLEMHEENDEGMPRKNCWHKGINCC